MLNMTNFEPALKEMYPQMVINNLVYKNRPFFAMVPKYKEFYGELLKMPIIYGNPQNRSATFSRALAGTTSTAMKAFLLTRVKNYSLASIDNETIEASKNNEGAFLRALQTEIDGALSSLGRDIASSLYLSGRGDIGQIASSVTVSSTSLPLANPEDVVHFEVGQVLVAATTNSGTITVKANGGTENALSITAIDRINGVLTMSAALDSFATNDWAAGDFLFIQGDVEATSSLKISGIAAWIPTGSNRSTLLAGSFFNVVRSADATRLGGIYYDGSTQPIEEALIDGAGLAGREGASPDTAFMSFKDYRNLVKSLGSKVQFVNTVVPAVGLSYEGIVIQGPRGPIKVYPDQDCPAGLVPLLQLDTWTLASLGEPVNLFKGDGTSVLRSPTADGLDIRCYSYANLGNKAPGWNAVVKVA